MAGWITEAGCCVRYRPFEFEELGKLDNGSGAMPVMYRIILNTAISLMKV